MKKHQNQQPSNDNIINIKYLASAMEELTELLEQEMLLISSNKPSQIVSLQAKKSDLIDFIESQKLTLSQNKEFLGSIEEGERQRLKNLAQKLHDITSLSSDVLSKEVYFKQELMKTISDLVVEKTAGAGGYTKDGKMDRKGIKKDPPSISINDKI